MVSAGPVAGTGLRFLPVYHQGNQNSSDEEAEQVANLVRTWSTESPAGLTSRVWRNR